MQHTVERLQASIFFVGAGAMAESIVRGLIYSRLVHEENIYVTNQQNQQRIQELKHLYHINSVTSMEEGCQKAEIIILAVKPWAIKEVCTLIKPYITEKHLIISVAAGVTTSIIEQMLGTKNQVVRVMPNTSSAICESATGICAGKHAGNEAIEIAQRIFETVGIVTIVKESQIDLVTAISGSGPAYIYYLIEGFEQAGMDMGLSQEDARKLVVQTVYGASKMLLELHEEPISLRKKVTSPSGTTEAGLKVLEQHHFHDILHKAVARANERAGEMRKEIEKSIWDIK